MYDLLPRFCWEVYKTEEYLLFPHPPSEEFLHSQVLYFWRPSSAFMTLTMNTKWRQSSGLNVSDLLNSVNCKTQNNGKGHLHNSLPPCFSLMNEVYSIVVSFHDNILSLSDILLLNQTPIGAQWLLLILESSGQKCVCFRTSYLNYVPQQSKLREKNSQPMFFT